jgi:uncharacterized membrane protein YvbJ
MPFCPKCWKEYPKDFIECNVCNVPLTEEKPDASKHESHHQDSKSSRRSSASGSPEKKIK